MEDETFLLSIGNAEDFLFSICFDPSLKTFLVQIVERSGDYYIKAPIMTSYVNSPDPRGCFQT